MLCTLSNAASVGGRVAVRGNGVGAVDETCFKRGRSTALGDSTPEMECLGVAPVREKQVAKVNLIVCSSGTIEDHAAKETFSVLQREMRVVPSRAILGDLEPVGLGVTRADTTLSNARHAYQYPLAL